MSIKSNLGKRHESILSQTLGVDFVDYSYNVSKSAKVSAETPSSKYQGSTDNLGVASKENMLRLGSTDLTGNGTEKVKKKFRRSMLGQRTKLHNLDSALNINKNIPLITEEPCENNPLTSNKEEAYNYLNTETPNEKYLKPLHSSSPHSEIRRQQKSVLATSKNNQQEAQTPPNPFECSESPTKFFETGIDEISAWSVFKTKLNGLKSPPASNEMDVKRSVTQLSKSSVKKNFKMKLFDNICENNIPNDRRNDDAESGSDPLKSREISKRPELLDWSCYKQYNTKESSKQPLIEYSKSFAYDLEKDYTKNNTNGNCIMKNEIYMSNVSHNTNKSEYTINNSDEDNDSLNDTIVAAVQKSASKTPKLSVISEEEYNSENKHLMETSLLNSASSEHSSDTKEETLSQESSNIKLELDQLNELCVTVQKHSNNIDKLLAELYKEKKQYNIHFSKLQESVKHLQPKYNTLSDNSIDKNIYINSNSLNKQRKKKRVISSKIKQSPALMLTPENTFASPFSSNKLSKKKKESFLNNYTELRKSFAYLQTPEHKSAKKPQFHNSIIYTPKSLSFCISEQMKRLDS